MLTIGGETFAARTIGRMGTYDRRFCRAASSRLILGAALTFAFAAGNASPSRAATYHVYGCQHPDSTPAPADGWTGNLMLYTQSSLCVAGSPSKATILPAPVPDWTHSELVWRHPAGGRVNLIAARIQRSVTLPASPLSGAYAYRLSTGIWAYGPVELREYCSTSAGCNAIRESSAAVTGLAGGDVWLTVECVGSCVPGTTTPPNVAIVRSDLSLADDVPPTASGIGGSLASGRTVWGVADLTYKAGDAGGGVYRHKLTVDGRTIVDDVADPNGGRCADVMPASGTPYEFDYVLPCAAKVDGRISLDLNRVAVGDHEIEASIEDAAGNARTIYSGRITVVSDPARRAFDAQGVAGLINPLGDRPGWVANGTNTSRDAVVVAYVRRLRHGRQAGAPTRTTTGYPHSPTLVARATAGGRPVIGAILTLLERESGSATWRATRSLTTSERGDVSARLGPGPSREVRFAYVPDSESSTFLSSPTLAVRVTPRVTLRATPGRLRTGQRVRFSGHVTGGRIPPTGLALSLQATGVDGRWLTFKTLRSTAAGRFSARYRFRATTGTVRYRFRVRVLRQGGYPFAAGHSRPVSVRVQG
jgi:hypothetical protein